MKTRLLMDNIYDRLSKKDLIPFGAPRAENSRLEPPSVDEGFAEIRAAPSKKLYPSFSLAKFRGTNSQAAPTCVSFESCLIS